jgi:hypothetical protein
MNSMSETSPYSINPSIVFLSDYEIIEDENEVVMPIDLEEAIQRRNQIVPKRIKFLARCRFSSDEAYEKYKARKISKERAKQREKEIKIEKEIEILKKKLEKSEIEKQKYKEQQNAKKKNELQKRKIITQEKSKENKIKKNIPNK